MQFHGMTRIHRLLSVKNYDDDHYEQDVDWYAGDCDDELDDTAYTAGVPTYDPELLEHFDGNLEDADASASHSVCIGKSQFPRST